MCVELQRIAHAVREHCATELQALQASQGDTQPQALPTLDADPLRQASVFESQCVLLSETAIGKRDVTNMSETQLT